MRTIQLLRSRSGEWALRTVSSLGYRLSEQRGFTSAGAARRAFFAEGEHQPYARMLILIEGSKPVIVRMGQKPPPVPREADDYRKQVLEAVLVAPPAQMH